MPRWEDPEEPVVVGQESVYGRTTPTTKLDPSVLRDEGIDIDSGFYPAN